MTVDDLAELLEGVPLRAEILVLAPDDRNTAYRIINVRVSNPRAQRHRPTFLYLVLETEGHPVSRLRLLRRRPFRP
ncbi:MAG: hypothetical protein OJJ21_03115 [Ferrovibrio sp.]|uniref:hypothetical protein n=1 Tax=Ferrovibrio sp. TaxID=1917215 RepID=UPI00262D0FE2|nr:hypothetical protein [Ferrovibrio sp.]MCW0232568.1 hypothetical protein [Ferrovibrio sp.]